MYDVCMYSCMRMYLCMHACMHVYMHACVHVSTHVCMCVVFMHACMHACRYICTYFCFFLISAFPRFSHEAETEELMSHMNRIAASIASRVSCLVMLSCVGELSVWKSPTDLIG